MAGRLLFLIGYMGCGKSSLGRKLAARLGVRLVDTDREVEQGEGASVNEIFVYAGEEYFRRCERTVLDAVIDGEEPCVVSTGGGLPLWQDNMARMNGAGVTVYIRRTAEQIASRLSPYGRARRPKLRGLSDGELVAFMRRDMAGREPRYAEAQFVLDCFELRDEEIVERIMERMQSDE